MRMTATYVLFFQIYVMYVCGLQSCLGLYDGARQLCAFGKRHKHHVNICIVYKRPLPLINYKISQNTQHCRANGCAVTLSMLLVFPGWSGACSLPHSCLHILGLVVLIWIVGENRWNTQHFLVAC